MGAAVLRQQQPTTGCMSVPKIFYQIFFLLVACTPALLATPSSLSDTGSKRKKADNKKFLAKILGAKIKRGIIAILARLKVLGMVANNRRFGTHAPSRSQTLNQPKDKELDLLGWKPTEKDKEKVLPDLPAQLSLLAAHKKTQEAKQ
ncbi:hypothetical protein PtB15_11B45 [Puccinia triticina]|nr:hypothetical protein PtB15_11B45 [Puccinia triticina]